MAEKNTLQIKYYKGLDILRFLAATCVLLHHASQTVQRRGADIEAHKYHIYSGEFFLDLFFIISGFLISLILFKELDNNSFNIKNFFIRRILRIWPLFFFIVLVRLILYPIITGVDAKEIITNLKYAFTFTTNFQLLFGEDFRSTYKILWSICVEEHIYFIFPFIALFLRKSRYLIAVLFIVIGILSFKYAGDLFNIRTFKPYFFSSSYLYYFGLGVFLSVLLAKNTEIFQSISRKIGHWAFQLIALLVGFAFVFNFVTSTNYSLYGQLLLNGLFATYLVFLAVSGKLLFDKFGIKTSRYLGNISYAMYLIHPIILGISHNVFFKTDPSSSYINYTLVYPLKAIVFTIIFSTLLYYLLERPFIKMKKKFAVVQSK